MKFRMFENYLTGVKVAVNVDRVVKVVDRGECCEIMLGGVGGQTVYVCVKESFDVVLSRLNTVAE